MKVFHANKQSTFKLLRLIAKTVLLAILTDVTTYYIILVSYAKDLPDPESMKKYSISTYLGTSFFS